MAPVSGYARSIAGVVTGIAVIPVPGITGIAVIAAVDRAAPVIDRATAVITRATAIVAVVVIAAAILGRGDRQPSADNAGKGGRRCGAAAMIDPAARADISHPATSDCG